MNGFGVSAPTVRVRADRLVTVAVAGVRARRSLAFVFPPPPASITSGLVGTVTSAKERSRTEGRNSEN